MPTHIDTGPAPVEPVETIIHALTAFGADLLACLALGVLIALALRFRPAHWSWSLLAAALAPLLAPPLGVGVASLAAAGLLAAALGRRWQLRDREGSLEPTIPGAAPSAPADLARRGLRAAADHVLPWAGARRWWHRGRLALGRDRRGRLVSVPFADGGRHTLVVGATGSGKTVTQTWIAERAIERGWGVVAVDPKGDPTMGAALRAAALEVGAPVIEWTPAGPAVYNPFQHGSESEIAEKALAGERFTEPHYLRQAQRYLGHAVRALRSSGGEASLQAIVELLDPATLELLARRLAGPQGDPVHAYLDSLTPRQRSDLSGVRDRLAILAESDAGQWLDPRTAGCGTFDILAAVRARSVVRFDLDADRRPLLAQMLGAAIVGDLQTTVATLQGHPIPTLVLLDEFSALQSGGVVRLFGRARSAGLSLVLGTQELSDLRPPGGERLLEQVLGNLSLLIAHRQVVPASAELVSSLAGSRGGWRVSRHSDGRSTQTAVRERLLPPEQVLGLPRGTAAIVGLDGSVPRLAAMFAPRGGREAGAR